MLLIHRLARFTTLESAGKYHIYRKRPKFRELNTLGVNPFALSKSNYAFYILCLIVV